MTLCTLALITIHRFITCTYIYISSDRTGKKKEERENGKGRQKRNYSLHYNTFSHFRSGRAGGGVRSVVVRDYHKHGRGGSRIVQTSQEGRISGRGPGAGQAFVVA